MLMTGKMKLASIGATALTLAGCTTMDTNAIATPSMPDAQSRTAAAVPTTTMPTNILLGAWTGPYQGVPP